MWKLLKTSPPYFITFLEDSKDCYYIGVTNFHKYWTKFITRSTFLCELKVSNEGLEFDDENELVERGLDMIKNPDTLKSVSVNEIDNEKLLNVSMTKAFEITLKIQITLLEAASQEMHDDVVQPLLKLICDLRTSQQELRELLLKKDREIEEYKIEGKAPRRLITTVYDDAAHMKKHTLYEDLFSAPELPEVLKSIAYTSNPKNKSRLLSSKSDAVSKDTLVKTEPTTSQASNKLQSQNGNGPLATSNIAPKIEKHSQNSQVDEIASILPTQIGELQSGLALESNVAVKVSEEAKSPVAKKRQKKRLNY